MKLCTSKGFVNAWVMHYGEYGQDKVHSGERVLVEKKPYNRERKSISKLRQNILKAQTEVFKTKQRTQLKTETTSLTMSYAPEMKTGELIKPDKNQNRRT